MMRMMLGDWARSTRQGHPLRRIPIHPGGDPGAILKSISRRCHPILVAFVWGLAQETIILPLGYFQGGVGCRLSSLSEQGTKP